MPWCDYRCPGCPGIIQNHRFSARLGAAASAPWCKVCEIQMVPIPAANFDLRSDSGRGSNQKFTVHRLMPTKDGPVQVEETVDSLHAAERIERDSEQRYKDHEGEPLRFRALHQNASNLDVNSFGESGRIGDRVYDSGHAPQKKSNITTTRHGQKKPKVRVARRGGVSPL